MLFFISNVYASRFNSRVLKIEKFMSHLPRQVIETVRNIFHLSDLCNTLRHVCTRIGLVKSLFKRTFNARIIRQCLVSLATQIEHSWYGPRILFTDISQRIIDIFNHSEPLPNLYPTIERFCNHRRTEALKLAEDSMVDESSNSYSMSDDDYFPKV